MGLARNVCLMNLMGVLENDGMVCHTDEILADYDKRHDSKPNLL